MDFSFAIKNIIFSKKLINNEKTKESLMILHSLAHMVAVIPGLSGT